MLWTALIGQLFGFVGSMPVAGPIAVLVVARSLDGRLRDGALIGLGAAVAEAVYAFLAYRGFSAYLVEVPLVAHASRGVGALVLAVVGVMLLRHRTERAVTPDDTAHASSFGLGMTITALNPTLIVTWTTTVGVVASIAVLDHRPAAAVAFAVGVGVGSAAWFAIAVRLVGRFRARVTAATIARSHRIFGCFVIVLAIALGVAFVRGVHTG